MTQKFKFGDLVIVDKRSLIPEIGVVVWVNNELGEARVCFEKRMLAGYRLTKYFELIPHPDTVRLEFIAAECDSTLDELREVLDKKQ